MHAVITTWSVPQGRSLAKYREVRAQLIPPVHDLPGFVAGYTTVGPNGGTAYEFTVFDNESAARAFMRRVGQDRPEQVEFGIQRSEVTLVEVVAISRPE
jgi:hypothetical protein